MSAADITRLNRDFGIPGQLVFVDGPSGPQVHVNNQHATATIALQGAHVMMYQPHNQQPLLWLSAHGKFAPGKSIRGGVPICWPWFGPHTSAAAYPGHGFARTVMWEVTAVHASKDGATRLELHLPTASKNIQQWPHLSEVALHVSVGERLELALITRNTGDQSFVLGDALHTYFQVSDIRRIAIQGLEGCPYIDKVDDSKRKTQIGGVTIAAETDRIYLDSTKDCVIDDPGYGRRIRIAKRNSRSTIVWNPWMEKAEKMGDLGPDGYLHMVCVESANADADVVTLAPGKEHQLQVAYSVEAIV